MQTAIFIIHTTRTVVKFGGNLGKVKRVKLLVARGIDLKLHNCIQQEWGAAPALTYKEHALQFKLHLWWHDHIRDEALKTQIGNTWRKTGFA